MSFSNMSHFGEWQNRSEEDQHDREDKRTMEMEAQKSQEVPSAEEIAEIVRQIKNGPDNN